MYSSISDVDQTTVYVHILISNHQIHNRVAFTAVLRKEAVIGFVLTLRNTTLLKKK